MEIVIRKARLDYRHDHKIVDIGIDQGKIVEISERITQRGEEEIDANGRLVVPPFFNMHFHLDSALTLGDPKFNESGTLWEGIRIWGEKKKKLTEEDVINRAERVIKWFVAYGTLWLRSHVDITEKSFTAVRALLRVKEEMKELINLQLTAFPQDGITSDKEVPELLEKAMEMGVDNVGMIPHNEPTREDGVKSIDIAFNIAKKYNRDIDGHIDETDDPNSRFLEVVARKTVEYNYQGRVSAGHVTAMHSWDPAYRFRILSFIRDAGITVVPNPLINITLQGRFDGYPKRRGMAPISLLLTNGINVALGHDCIMDPWYPLGVGDMLQVLFMAVHVDQLTGYNDLLRSLDLITYNGAKAWRVSNYGIEKGNDANLLVLNAKNEIDALRILGPPLYVIKDGKIIAKSLNREYSEVYNKGRWEKISFFMDIT